MTAPWMPPLPEPPAFYRYQFSSFYGDVWRSDHREWNGHTPKATEGLYTADQMRRAQADAARAALEQAAKVCERQVELAGYGERGNVASVAAHCAGSIRALAKEIT